MAVVKFNQVYVLTSGEFISGPWVGETAQFGIRMNAGRPTITTPDITGTLPERDSEPIYDSGTWANGQWVQGWQGETIGTDTYWSKNVQQAMAEDIYTFLSSTTMRSATSSSFAYKRVRLSPIGLDGKPAQAHSEWTFDPELAGTANDVLPPKIALALSLRTPVPGRQGRGRIYIPALSYNTMATDGRVKTTIPGNWLPVFKDLVNALNSHGDSSTSHDVVITSAGKTEYVRPVEVRLGNHFDTQRRREAQIPEQYTTLTL